MNNNGAQQKIPVTCPGCQTAFSIAMPRMDIANGLFTSAVIGPHSNLSKCIACGQQFILMITGAQVQWTATPVGPDVAQQVEGSSLITPGIIVPT